MAHMPTWHVHNVIQMEVLEDFQRIALHTTQNRPGITALTVHPATAPVIGMRHSRIPTLVTAVASITTRRAVRIVTQAVTILHQTAVNAMTAITQMVAEEYPT